MDHTRKKNIKRVISMICITAVVALLAAMPLLAKSDVKSDGPQASILSGTVGTSAIDTTLYGGGTLTEEDTQAVELPSAVKLTQFLVTNGDTVLEGDPIATVDRVTVMTAIAQVQETLDHLSEEIEAAAEDDSGSEVAALAGGTVKLVYAKKGDSVRDVMLSNGALAVLSLDGRMAVELETESHLPTGSTVNVTLSDETTVNGRVESNLDGEMVVTVEDDGYAVGEAVRVTAEDGSLIGSGALSIHSPWNATAYAGTIGSVEIGEGDEVDAGETLMKLSGTGSSAAYQRLVNQRQEYESLMIELFVLYQTETVTAPCGGVVSGVDENSVQLLAAKGEGFVLELLANAPNGDDETMYANFIGQVDAVGIDGLVMRLNPAPLPIADYTDLSQVPTDPALMTQSVIYSEQAPVYALLDGQWTQLDPAAIVPGDTLLFACDPEGSFVWVVRIQPMVEEPEEPIAPSDPTEPSAPSEPVEPTQPSEPAGPTEPTDPTTPTVPNGSAGSGSGILPGITYPSGSGSFGSGSFGGSGGGSWSGISGYPQTGITGEEEFELYSMETSQIAAVTPQHTMTVEITVDELDISLLNLGAQADIKLSALNGQHFPATITAIGNTGVNSGGNSKFTVELTLSRSGNMLAGMSAAVSIPLSTAQDVLSVPVKALAEVGSKTVVYTGYDEEAGALTGPVEVSLGISDEENAQILSGLNPGQTYYYAYYDTLEISYTPDFSPTLFG